MHRRDVLKGVATSATGGILAIAGCSSSGGATGEVVQNEFDNLKVQSHQLENTTKLGTKAVECVVTVKNTGSEAIDLDLNVELYDGDTVVAADEAARSATVESGVSKEVKEAHEGRKEDVTRYEISLTEQEGIL